MVPLWIQQNSAVTNGQSVNWRENLSTMCENWSVRQTPMEKSQQRVSRALGYHPLSISAGIKRAIWSAILAVPCALTATGISGSTAVSDVFRYLFSPGTMLALRIIRVEPSHRGLGVFVDALNWYGRAMSFALWVNAIFYGLLIFGGVTTISVIKAETRRD